MFFLILWIAFYPIFLLTSSPLIYVMSIYAHVNLVSASRFVGRGYDNRLKSIT